MAFADRASRAALGAETAQEAGGPGGGGAGRRQAVQEGGLLGLVRSRFRDGLYRDDS